MAQTPAEIANRVLDACSVDKEIGSLEDGGREANVLLRAYGPGRQQLMRTAPWQFARRDAPMLLLADATGNTPNVGTVVPSGWIYEYAQPTDIARIRFIPGNPLQNTPVPTGNIVPSNSTSPLTTGATPIVGMRQVPSRYLITNDPNYPSPAGATTYAAGQSPQGSVVILSNVPKANIVYTYDALYPSVWDAHFTEALVAYLAQQVALPLWVNKDKKFGLEIRNQQIAITKQKLLEARVTDGNSQFSSSDIRVDWMDYRRVGGTWSGWGQTNGGGDGWGCWGAGWNGSCSLADGTAF